MDKQHTIALVGNPNCGKTTIFNELTGSKQHVGNWPGVTVEKKEGIMKFEGKKIKVVDLPGIYSLGAYSEDEIVARNYILEDKPDVLINVIDSTNIERNLYLTVQLLEMDVKVVLALNMSDEAKNKNIIINKEKLKTLLGVPVIDTTGIKGMGLDEVVKEAMELLNHKTKNNLNINYGSTVQGEIKNLEDIIESITTDLKVSAAWTALKLIENDEYIIKKINDLQGGQKIIDMHQISLKNIEEAEGYEADAFIIDKKYEYIDEIIKKSINKNSVIVETTSDKIDRVVTNKWLGIPIFALIMFLMYQIAIKFGNDFLGGFVDSGFSALGDYLKGVLSNANPLVQSFVTDGLVSGLGSVFVFVPMIFVMYFLISILEDSGYMARAAYVMDRFMSSIGLHGKTAVSMIIGGGCNVAGILSTRTLESKKDRMISILINPFISCSARLPVYALFTGAFFANKRLGIFSAGGVVIFSLYALGIIVAIISGKILSKTVFKGETSYFVMELPPYRIPTLKGVVIHMWEKGQSFLKKMGTIIFAIVTIVWALSNLPYGVEPGSANSILGIIGQAISPVLKPTGFASWQSAVALITGIGAKEAVVATLGTVYGAAQDADLSRIIQQNFTPLTAYAFMVMTLLYIPCAATIGAIKRETNSIKWAVFSLVYTSVIGWAAAVIIYQLGHLLGLG